MEINSHPPKKLTRTKYVSKMRRFLKDEAKKSPSWDPPNLLEMDRPGDRLPVPPSVESCFSRVQPVSSRHGIIYAHQKFVKFLQAYLGKFETTMFEDRFKSISEYLAKRYAQTKLGVGAQNQKRVVQGRRQKQKEAQRRRDWKERPAKVFTLMAKLLKCDTVNHLLDNLEELDMDKFVVWNFLMSVCLVVCGGLRPDVIRGMTLADWIMMVLIFLEFSPTPLAIRLISQELNIPINVPTDPKIPSSIRFVRRWSSGRDSMMSLMLLMTLAILFLAESIKLALSLAYGWIFRFADLLLLFFKIVRDFE